MTRDPLTDEQKRLIKELFEKEQQLIKDAEEANRKTDEK